MTFVTSIDDIEAQTGIDFFSKLENEFEIRLEANIAPEA